MANKEDQGIQHVANVLSAPIIVWPGYEDALPQWIREDIPMDRLLHLMKGKEPEMATDLEAVAYMMTASFVAPLPHDVVNIYLWAAAKVLKERGRKSPPDLAPKKLSDQEMWEYRRLKEWIYRSQQRGKRTRRARQLVPTAMGSPEWPDEDWSQPGLESEYYEPVEMW